jgi:DNA-binding response OmpR family regulator
MIVDILFVEDEISLGQLVKEALENEADFKVHWVTDGDQVMLEYKRVKPGICVLDIMLPHVDGFTLAQKIRDDDKNIPILFLTARSQTSDVIKGFEIGGNDYLKKPFSIAELVMRIRELVKRTNYPKQQQQQNITYHIGQYEFQPEKHILRIAETKYRLTNRETALLHKLVIHKNSLMDRKETLLELWGDENFFHARNMDVYIAKLRKYLNSDPNISIINIRGFGYKLIEGS